MAGESVRPGFQDLGTKVANNSNAVNNTGLLVDQTKNFNKKYQVKHEQIGA